VYKRQEIKRIITWTSPAKTFAKIRDKLKIYNLPALLIFVGILAVLAGIPWIVAGCSGVNGRTTATSITNFSESTTQTDNGGDQSDAQRERARVSTTQAGNGDGAGSKTDGKSTPNKMAANIPKGVHGQYVLLAWNDLGMHCYNNDFKDIAILPPYNNLLAQVIMQGGDEPKIITKGVTITYSFPENTYSAGKKGMPDKTNFWNYAQKLFGLSKPLPVNVGLKGNSLSGTMKQVGDHYMAEGIPLTEYRDIDAKSRVRYPYQKAVIEARQTGTGKLLARTIAVAPVSTEMHCDRCHSDKGSATKQGKIKPTGSANTNILALHDKLNSDKYADLGYKGTLMSNRPVLCASCHGSNALGIKGKGNLPSMSGAIHKKHSNVKGISNDQNGCYNCHPGTQTKCLRGVHYKKEKMNCVSCHGTLKKVSTNPNPWLNEPRCDNANCHHNKTVPQTQLLYRNSKAHGGIYCEGCHDSTHAIAPSIEANDAIKFIDLQGKNGTLSKCTVCHTKQPNEKFSHKEDENGDKD
jgi:hypothetical protein